MSTTPKTPTNLGSGQAEATEDKLHSGPEAYERFRDFARRIAAVPKQEADQIEAAQGTSEKAREKKPARGQE